MRHQLITPPESLTEFVRYFWTLEDEPGVQQCKTFHTLVDDSTGIIIQHHNGNSAFAHPGNAPLQTNFIYGQSTRPTTTFSKGSFRLAGVQFRPQAIKTLFGIDAFEMKDQMVGLHVLGDGDVAEMVMNSRSPGESIAILSEYLLDKARRVHMAADPLVSFSIHRIRACRGQNNISALAAAGGVSERQLERRFKMAVGVTPKFYTRMVRFRSAMQLIQQKKYMKLSDVAFELEYADQAHFIRDIRDFSGYTPKGLSQEVNELILNLHLGEPCSCT